MQRFTFILVLCFVTALSFGQQRGTMAVYDPDTVETVQGVITSIEIGYNRFMDDMGLHLFIETPDEEYKIHVCPEWFMVSQDMRFRTGEEITVEGSVFEKDGTANIYAAALTRGSDLSLQLRDLITGEALWTGRDQQQTPGSGNRNEGP